MKDKNTPTISTLSSRLTTPQAIELGNMLAFILVSIAAIQAIWLSASTSWYIYTLELILPIFVAGYHIGINYYYRSWLEKHRKIASMLEMAKKEYYKQAFALKRPKNFFEVKLLAKEGLNPGFSKNGVKREQKGRTWSGARRINTQAEKRLEKTKRISQRAGRVDLNLSDANYINDRLAVADFKSAGKAISDIHHRNKEYRTEVKKILKMAKKACCYSIILQRLEKDEFDLEEARDIILVSRNMLEKAGRLGGETVKAVVAELEKGNLEEAERSIVAAKKERIKQQAKEDIKEELISNLRYEIGRLPEPADQERLLKDLVVLENLEFDTKTFWASAHELEDQILRFEIKTATTG